MLVKILALSPESLGGQFDPLPLPVIFSEMSQLKRG